MNKQPKERPILFNREMVIAILNGRKTQTRRIVKPQPGGLFESFGELQHDAKFGYGFHDGERYWKSHYGQPGDKLWVRETMHQEWRMFNGSTCSFSVYSADSSAFTFGWHYSRKTCPSIHMPRFASRINLEITDIRVERLHDISEEDAIAEGIPVDYLEHVHGPGGYRDLYEAINGTESLDKNPWVWVIEFKRIVDGANV